MNVNQAFFQRERGKQIRPSWVALAVILLACGLGITIPTRSANSFSFTTIDPPGATRTGVSGINRAGHVVGAFRDAGGKWHGFLRSATGTFTPIDVPGATGTYAHGINRASQVAGFFEDEGGKQHGFVRAATGAFTPFDVPGAADTGAIGINDAGQIVGDFVDAGGRRHGFVTTR